MQALAAGANSPWQQRVLYEFHPASRCLQSLTGNGLSAMPSVIQAGAIQTLALSGCGSSKSSSTTSSKPIPVNPRQSKVMGGGDITIAVP